MRKNFKSLILQLFFAVFIFSACFSFVLFVPESSSWLHREQNLTGSYKIGKIDLWLNGLEDSITQINVRANAPTRFFTQDENRDNYFDVAVNPYQIFGLNKGDIDVKVDVSVIDNNAGNNSLFYIFVPANTTDENFLAGKYRDYLDSVFNGYTLSTPAQCKAAMNAINQNTLNSNKGTTVLKDANTPIFYMLVWSEYDNIANIASSAYISLSYPITVKAYSYQLYHQNP